LDFAWPEVKIATEIHGGIFMPKGSGGHNRGAFMEDTFEKHNEAIRRGWSVFTFGPKWLYRSKRSEPYSKAAAFIHKILVGGAIIPLSKQPNVKRH
jgi:hypothetical protein